MTEALESLWQAVDGVALDNALGLAIALLALVIPFRPLAAKPRVGLDIAAALVVTIFVVLVQWLLDVPAELVAGRLAGWHQRIEQAPLWLVIPAYVVLADFGAYWAHRALHTPLLWPTHAWHHSPKYLYWLSALRGSPIHLLVLLAPYYAAFLVFSLPEAAAAAGAVFVLDVANQHYIHSNLRLPFAPQIEKLFVTPRFHFVHHSTTPHVANSNYGFVFSVWDRLFGTVTDPATVPQDDALGLGYEISEWRLALGLPPAARRTR